MMIINYLMRGDEGSLNKKIYLKIEGVGCSKIAKKIVKNRQKSNNNGKNTFSQVVNFVGIHVKG